MSIEIDTMHLSARTNSNCDTQVVGDETQMNAQESATEMPRIFSLTSTLAMAFSITNTWIGYSATFVTPLLAGGGPAVFFCLVLACLACSIIALGLAELASAFPSSGGQYQSVSLRVAFRTCQLMSFLAMHSWLLLRSMVSLPPLLSVG
jgi:amino acid transporter